MNNKLIDYYEAENNPDTNDTAEDSIDELFENIPLYHYLNTVFAKTEAEFEDSLMKGLNASYNAFMNLPYTSSMMGDIAVAEPQNAFAHEPYVSQFNIPGKNIKISDSQFGKKVGEHAEDFGLNPSNPESRYHDRAESYGSGWKDCIYGRSSNQWQLLCKRSAGSCWICDNRRNQGI